MSVRLDFPFRIQNGHVLSQTNEDDIIRDKIIQVLFTTPGERVNVPEFSCGLLQFVFEPNNDILAATLEFTIMEALSRWMKEDIIVETVNLKSSPNGSITAEIIYKKKPDLSRQGIRIEY